MEKMKVSTFAPLAIVTAPRMNSGKVIGVNRISTVANKWNDGPHRKPKMMTRMVN